MDTKSIILLIEESRKLLAEIQEEQMHAANFVEGSLKKAETLVRELGTLTGEIKSIEDDAAADLTESLASSLEKI